MAENKQLQSIFPDLPRESPVIDKDGNFTSLWSLGFSSLFQALQQNFKNEGILFPSLSGANTTTIQAIYTPYIGAPLPSTLPDISGQTIFNTTSRISQQFVITYDTSNPANILSAQWINLTMMVFSTANPNGVLAGASGWLCYDSVHSIMYICTVSGSTATATWVAFT